MNADTHEHEYTYVWLSCFKASPNCVSSILHVTQYVHVTHVKEVNRSYLML